MTELARHADIALEVSNFIALLWEEIEKNEGNNAADFFTEDGVFDSKIVCFNGRQEIKEWFSWRRDMVRTARHLITNLHFDFSAWHNKREVTVRSVMTHFGAAGKGVLPMTPPIGIYDQTLVVRQGGQRGWSIALLLNAPVFLAEDHPAKRYPKAVRQD